MQCLVDTCFYALIDEPGSGIWGSFWYFSSSHVISKMFRCPSTWHVRPHRNLKYTKRVSRDIPTNTMKRKIENKWSLGFFCTQEGRFTMDWILNRGFPRLTTYEAGFRGHAGKGHLQLLWPEDAKVGWKVQRLCWEVSKYVTGFLSKFYQRVGPCLGHFFSIHLLFEENLFLCWNISLVGV